MVREVYLDNAATTRVDEEAAEAVKKCMLANYGNPLSLHGRGVAARKELEKARKAIASSMGAQLSDIVFTSGGTESDNLAIKGIARARGKGHIITSKVEHPAVLHACEELEKDGFDVTYLGVDGNGVVNLEELENAIRNDTILVSIIFASNETGTIQPVEKIGNLCRKHGIPFHTDAVQAYLKVQFKVDDIKADLVSISSHKVHGPKGVGALYIRDGVEIEKLMSGGPHEHDMRAGTQNLPGIAGFAKAVENFGRKDIEKMQAIRDYMKKELMEIPYAEINGGGLCSIISITFREVDSEDLMSHLNHKGIFMSAGSACTSQTMEPSHVLKAMGMRDEARSTIRISLSRFTEEEEAKHAIESMKAVVTSLRKLREMEVKQWS